MNHFLNRRHFLQAAATIGAGLGGAALSEPATIASEAAAATGAPHAEKLGWRLGCQAYTFNHYTFFEAIDKTAGLGLHYIEAYPGQKISQEIKAKFGPGLSVEQRKIVKQKLADSGVKLVNFGVTDIVGRQTFEFAKEMGIETIVSEPGESDFGRLKLGDLCDEYQINIAIHNHPAPSPYWNPDTVLRVTKGLSKRVGACCDTGHWVRSGLNAVECLKKLDGRIISFHFKDLNKSGHDAHDVPWGTGVSNVQGMLTEIHRQGVKGLFSIEYEHKWTTSLPEIAQCVAYFDKVAAAFAK